ncbi:fumarylacetoacetate hydrolase family protein [Kribbella solani]|uniref:fumarylacetoacetate hydrolase family protein n=1 Tax=Kribbella solani TaxID=236067 RepID=UPI0029AF1BC8|nr:fumarylacetoacetate hydrolase family protein [Kribbella solani]MDX3005620.1 fumarylacetoacetate hydrolase family protein [Kribbella solani]
MSGEFRTAADFRLGCVGGRAALNHGGRWVDLAELTGDAGLVDVNVALSRVDTVRRAWLECDRRDDLPVVTGAVSACVPEPRQVFAVGLNYREHAAEAGLPAPVAPMVFTKFPSCITAPGSTVRLSGPKVDWEVELVVVIGAGGRDLKPADAWDAVAALTVGQDVSDREMQLRDTPPQFSLGKSFAGYGPLAPVAVGLDAFADVDDVGLWCSVDGELRQQGRTSDLFFSVPELVASLSAVCELLPGDLIFTGTPAGVGAASGQYLTSGSVLVSGADEIGEFEIGFA